MMKSKNKISLSIAVILCGWIAILNAEADKDPTDARLRKVEIGGVGEVAIPNIDHKGRRPANLNDLDPELTDNKETRTRNAYGQEASKIQKKREAKVIDRMKERAQEDLEEQEKKMKLRRQ